MTIRTNEIWEVVSTIRDLKAQWACSFRKKGCSLRVQIRASFRLDGRVFFRTIR
jgi:hypothetical protein